MHLANSDRVIVLAELGFRRLVFDHQLLQRRLFVLQRLLGLLGCLLLRALVKAHFLGDLFDGLGLVFAILEVRRCLVERVLQPVARALPLDV